MSTNYLNPFSDNNEVPSEGQERLIVELDSDYNSLSHETPKVKICFQKWATGIGWFNQKSLYLTLDQAAFLEKEIGRAAVNHKMRSTQSHPATPPQAEKNSSGAGTPDRVIQFPAGKSKKAPTARQNPSHSEAKGSPTATILPFRPR